MSSNGKHQPLDFSDLKVITIPVTTPNGKYILQEASGLAAAEYKNFIIDQQNLIERGESNVSLGDAPSVLVSRCLFSIDEDGNASDNVPIDKVKKLPERILQVLFEKAKQISGLDNLESEESDSDSPNL